MHPLLNSAKLGYFTNQVTQVCSDVQKAMHPFGPLRKHSQIRGSIHPLRMRNKLGPQRAAEVLEAAAAAAAAGVLDAKTTQS